MKLFTGLYLILIAFCVFLTACDETGMMLDIVDDVIVDDTTDWHYLPEKNITLNFPEWLKDGSQGQIGLGEAHPQGRDESFMLQQWQAVFYQDHIFIPDKSATHVYVFDMNGNLLDDKTVAREVILGGRASRFAPHFGNVSLEGKFLGKTHPRQSVADYVRYMSIEGNILTIEVGWYPGFQGTWITRMGFAETTTTYWNMDTGDITFGRTVKSDCWVSWKGADGQTWGNQVWCDDAADYDPDKPYPYGSRLLFSTETHDYFINSRKNGTGGAPFDYSKPYKILTKDGIFVGHFNPDMLVHSRDNQWRFRKGIYYENTLYMLAETVPHNDVDKDLGIDPYTFYAFQQIGIETL